MMRQQRKFRPLHRAASTIVVAFTALMGSHAQAQFSTVINIPPDVAPNGIASDTQLNLHDGGMLPDFFDAGERGGASTNAEVNILGGMAGHTFHANQGSTVSISGGIVGDSFQAGSGSTVTIAGGTVGRFFSALDGSNVAISAGSVGSGLAAWSGSTVEISGGSVGDQLSALQESAVTISGGVLGEDFTALPTSTLTITGGSVGNRFEAWNGSTVSLSGGSLGDQLDVAGSSTMTISGGEFQLDGVSVSGLETEGNTVLLDVPPDTLFTGTLADGTPFAFTSDEGDSFDNGALTLQATALPPIGPAVISASSDPVPLGIRQGQTLHVDDGGVVPDHFNAGPGSSVDVQPGGRVGRNFEAIAAQVTITGGLVGDAFDAFTGSTVSVTGGDFRLNGDPLSGLETAGTSVAFDVPPGATLSGTMVDGTPFAFSTQDGDSFANGVLTLHAASLPPTGPPLIVASSDPVPQGIREAQTLRVDDGGVAPDEFSAGWGSTVNVEAGGQVGRNLEAVGADVAISGGLVGDHFDAFTGTTVTISGGSVGKYFGAHSGSRITISGGVVDDHFHANSDSTVEITGGEVADSFQVFGTAVEISGGTVGRNFHANDGSTVNISGGEIGDGFRVDDNSIATISGGTVDNHLSSRGGSTVTISGGNIGGGVRVDTHGTLNISGGNVGDFLFASLDSTVNISGGSIGSNFQSLSRSTVNLTGGSVGDSFEIDDELNITGGQFRHNGQPVGGLENEGNIVDLFVATGDLLSGTLADGTPFAFTRSDGDLSIRGRQVTLQAANLPAIGPSLITASTDPLPFGIRQGQTLRVDDGAVVPDNFNAGLGSTVAVEPGGRVEDNLEATQAAVTITGGSIGHQADAFASTLDISAGSIGDDFLASHGSTINVTGGTVGNEFRVLGNSTVNISGGSIGVEFKAFGDSTVNLSGGSVGSRFLAHNDSTVNITGGSLGDLFEARGESMVTLFGGDFRLDGVRVAGLDVEGNTVAFDVPQGALFTGTLADGTPFAFSSDEFDTFASGLLTLHATALPPVEPAVITASTDPVPLGIRQGQTLRVDDGGIVPMHFNAGPGSTTIVEPGGQVGGNFEAVGAEVIIVGGEVDGFFDAFAGSTVHIQGGSIGRGFAAYAGSTVIVSGGTFAGRFDAFSGSEIHILGRQFSLDGVPITELAQLGDSLVLENRDGQHLRGTLRDGTPFDFQLNTTIISLSDFFDPDATLRLTVVPEPAAAMLALLALLACCISRSVTR